VDNVDNIADEDLDDELLTEYAACCPVTPAVADRLVAVARLTFDDVDDFESALLDLGFVGDDVEMDDALARTPEGHLVYGDDALSIPFAYSYGVGGELHPEDSWGTLPGWSSQAEPDHDVLDAQIEAVVQAFTTSLGAAPEVDVRAEDRNRRRHVAWRVGSNLLVVAQTLEPFSYMQDDHAVVHIAAAPGGPDAPIPADPEWLATFAIW
jgi:hypothetical protein